MLRREETREKKCDSVSQSHLFLALSPDISSASFTTSAGSTSWNKNVVKTLNLLLQFLLDDRRMGWIHRNVHFSIGKRTVFSTADTVLRPAVRLQCPWPLVNGLRDLGSIIWNLREMMDKGQGQVQDDYKCAGKYWISFPLIVIDCVGRSSEALISEYSQFEIHMCCTDPRCDLERQVPDTRTGTWARGRHYASSEGDCSLALATGPWSPPWLRYRGSAIPLAWWVSHHLWDPPGGKGGRCPMRRFLEFEAIST